MIYVAGHRGLVGSSLLRRLQSESQPVITRTRAELDLCDQAAVNAFFRTESIQSVVFCAGRVGGIMANDRHPAEFCYDNIAMATNAIHAAYTHGVQRFLFLGSTCIYPRDCPQPIRESELLNGPLEPTNEGYAIAKIAGIKLCAYYRRQYGVNFHSVMPTNLYGPGDNYHPEHSHVLPALLRRFHEAEVGGQEEVVIWGTGTPRREFLYVDDLADALWHLLQLAEPPDWVNVGTGTDISIRELAELVSEVVGYQGRIAHDLSKPDGMPVKRTDTSRIHALGWHAKTDLRQGLARTYECFLQESASSGFRT